MRKYRLNVLLVLSLGLQSTQSMAASICNGGTDCPDAVFTPISATGSSNDLSDPENVVIAVGNSLLVEANVDCTSFPIVDVFAADLSFVITVNSGSGLNCDDATFDLSRSDRLLGTCSQCAAVCPPPYGIFGTIDFSGAGHTVDYFAYTGEMTLTCTDVGTFTVEFFGTAAKTVVQTVGGDAINISDDPTHFKSMNVACVNVPGQCCVNNDCVDSACAVAGGNTTTSEGACIACGGSWTFGGDCSDPCLCDSNADCEDNDACTDNVCLGNGQCSFQQTAAAQACEAQGHPLCEIFECNADTGACDNVFTLCDDNDACTDNNCMVGLCSFPQNAAAAACAALSDPPCSTFECNSVSGSCDDVSSINNGTACIDNNSCTDGDECLAGICDPGDLILGRTCAGDSDCDNVGEGIPADPGTCVATVCSCPLSSPPPTVVADIGSRYVQITPDMNNTDAVAFRVECNGVIEWIELTPALTDYDDGPQGLVNVGIGRGACDNSYFLTPDAWTSGGANPLVVTGVSVAPGSRPTVYAVFGDCTTQQESAPVQPTLPTWVFGDSDGDGQVTFVADLFRQYSNNASVGVPFFTGPQPGTEVDTQGNSPSVPDQQITGFDDVFKCFQATTAGGSATWSGQACP